MRARRMGKTPGLFMRGHWQRVVRETPLNLRLFWAFRNDPRGFAFTEAELDALRRAAAGEDVGLPTLTPERAAMWLQHSRTTAPIADRRVD